MWFFFSIFIIFFVGNVVLRIIGNQNLNRMERIVVSFGLGLLALSLIQLYATFIKIPLNRMNIFLLISPFFILQSYYLSKEDIDFSRIIKLVSLPKISNFLLKVRAITIKINILESLSIIYLILLCFIMLSVCLITPMYTWDSRATWGFKAKALFNNHTIFADDFFDGYRFHPNTPYPLLIPLAENFFYNLVGGVDDYAVKIIFALFYINLIIFIYITQRKYLLILKDKSLIFTCLFASLPFLFVTYSGGSVPSAYADFPLAFFYTLSIVYLLNYMKNRNIRTVILAALFSCCCIFTKNEGIPLFIISIIILLRDGIKNKYLLERRNILSLLLYILLPILLLAPWFIIKSKLPRINYNNPLPFLNVNNLLANIKYIGLFIKFTFSEMFMNYSYWGIAWFIVVMAIIVKMRKGESLERKRYLLLIPAVYNLFVIAPIYIIFVPMVSTFENEFNGANFERLCLHTFPLLMLFVFCKINQLFICQKNE